ncbi:hypothetical protein CDL12_18851 [Handroanthus impetiginosus]|uniref:Senescence regulator S40 n=1 Tax=Handroanthus impetiginosus TaxID=429701 RepID=A0A2G9GTH0_9LAMI|nr:hypothetical protein CDL12_18851 [Handroanthus impetiginosus]
MAAALGTEDFQEDEVWAMMKARESSSSSTTTRKGSSSSSAWRFTATPRAIPRSTSSTGGGGAHQDFPGTARRQSSAPVNIPDWSKILKKRPKKNLWDDACDAYNDDDDGGRKYDHVKIDDDVGGDDDGDDDDDDDILPPHEYLARRLASTQIASFSMCEGVGRTLKGRDLSNLRNAILTKTGFLE